MPSLQELLQQRSAIEHEITRVRNDSRAVAIGQILAIMSENGLALEDVSKALQGAGGRREGGQGVRRPVAPKYRDPESGSTWSGRGLRPKWLAGALASGKTLADFAI